MPDPLPGAQVPATPAPAAQPAAAKPAVPSPAPAAPQVQPPAAVKPAAPATPAPAQPATMVPLHELQQERDRRQQLEAELGKLRQPAQPQYQQPPVQQQYVPVAGIDPKAELEKLWDTDPKQAVRVEIMYAMDWRDRVENNLNLQADQLAAADPNFNTFRSQALNYVRTLPAHQRGAPGILQASYQMLRGQNVDQIVAQREAEWMARVQRGEITAQQLQQPAGGGYTAPVATPGGTLTAQQLAAAQAMKIDPVEYAKYIKLQPVR